ncbi:hypothetical protein M0R36_00620 [bacterium]|jgi:hypothetical protein|nr:hypothetical protein [bacterium]
MLKRLKAFFVFPAVIICSFSVSAQKDFEIRKIWVDTNLQLEEIGQRSGGLNSVTSLGKKHFWAAIYVNYRSLPLWADDVKLVYYVALGAGSKSEILYGEENYANVEKGISHKAVIYVPPQVLARYGDVQKITVDIYYRNKLQDSQNFRFAGGKQWWKEKKLLKGLLKTKKESPFALDNFNEYELVREQ